MRKKTCGRSVSVLTFLLSILLLLSASNTQASTHQPVTLNLLQGSYNLGFDLAYYEDKTGNSSFQEVRTAQENHQFIASDREIPSFGYTNSAYWVHFVIKNPLQTEKELLLELAHPFMKSIVIYYSFDGKTYSRRTGGIHLRRTNQDIRSRNHVFSFSFPPVSTTRFFLRFENGGPMNFPLLLWSFKSYINKVDLERIILGSFYGVFISLLIYNFMIFFALRDRSYLYYVIFLGLVILYQLAADGLGYQYLWKSSQWFSVNSILLWHLLIIAYTFFTRSFLETRKYTPRLDKILLSIGNYSPP